MLWQQLVLTQLEKQFFIFTVINRLRFITNQLEHKTYCFFPSRLRVTENDVTLVFCLVLPLISTS